MQKQVPRVRQIVHHLQAVHPVPLHPPAEKVVADLAMLVHVHLRPVIGERKGMSGSEADRREGAADLVPGKGTT